MRIHALEIDGFGVWTELRLDALGEQLTVFYGPNEAGKTTLLQFIRSVLYGFAAERRRYCPRCTAASPAARCGCRAPPADVRSRGTRRRPPAAERAGGRRSSSRPDGARHGEPLLKTLLCGVDEAIFNNVFAVGLHELQELAVLTDTEARLCSTT